MLCIGSITISHLQILGTLWHTWQQRHRFCCMVPRSYLPERSAALYVIVRLQTRRMFSCCPSSKWKELLFLCNVYPHCHRVRQSKWVTNCYYRVANFKGWRTNDLKGLNSPAGVLTESAARSGYTSEPKTVAA
jgi:hypothetical protein